MGTKALGFSLCVLCFAREICRLIRRSEAGEIANSSLVIVDSEGGIRGERSAISNHGSRRSKVESQVA
jgi:hypothetical protein